MGKEHFPSCWEFFLSLRLWQCWRFSSEVKHVNKKQHTVLQKEIGKVIINQIYSVAHKSRSKWYWSSALFKRESLSKIFRCKRSGEWGRGYNEEVNWEKVPHLYPCLAELGTNRHSLYDIPSYLDTNALFVSDTGGSLQKAGVVVNKLWAVWFQIIERYYWRLCLHRLYMTAVWKYINIITHRVYIAHQILMLPTCNKIIRLHILG